MKDEREKQLLEMLKQRDQRIEELEKENALLRQKIDLLIRKVFGSSSEKLDPSQFDLFLLTTENTSGKSQASSALEEANPQPSRRHGPRNQERQPEDLPVVEQVIDPEEVTAQPDQWRCIGQEVSEQLDYEPAGSFDADWCDASTSRASIHWMLPSSPSCHRCCRKGARLLPDCWHKLS